MKFLHCADIHLDMPFSSPGMTPEKSSVRRQDLRDTFRSIISIAKAENVDIVLISGDLYEHDYIKKSTISMINDNFKEIPDKRIFIVPGNHDPYITNSLYQTFDWSDNVSILTRDNPFVILEDLKTCVFGVGFNNFYEDKSLIYDLHPVNHDYINILLVHGTVDMNFKKSMYNPMASTNLESLGMDYIALGHFHNRIEDIGGYGMIYNPGSPEPLGFDETGEHGVFVGQITYNNPNERHLTVKFVQTNIRYYENIEVNVGGCSNDQQVTEKIQNSIKGGNDVNRLICIKLKGYIDREYRISTGRIQVGLKDKFFLVRVKDETLPDYDFGQIILEPSIKGVFVQKVSSMIEKSNDDYERKILTKALYYGIEALEQGKIRISEE